MSEGSEARAWSPKEVVGYMLNCEQAEVQLGEIHANIFRQQAMGSVQLGHGSYWQAVEREWKDETGGKPIPSRYRSSKSVLKSALKLGLYVVGKGKTELEKEIKQAKVGGSSERSGGGGGTPIEVEPLAEKVRDVDFYKAEVLSTLRDAERELDHDDYLELTRWVREYV